MKRQYQYQRLAADTTPALSAWRVCGTGANDMADVCERRYQTDPGLSNAAPAGLRRPGEPRINDDESP